MRETRTARLLLRPFRESDYGDLYEFLSQLRDDGFEGCPGIPRDFGAREVGFIMGERFRRRGYAPEALAAVKKTAFAEGAHRVCAE